MTDEMRAAESLVRNLAPPGLSVPIPEPLALDESTWFLTAVDKGLIELTACPEGCARRRTGDGARDHFDTPGGDRHHLFGSRSGETDVSLRRELVPLVAAYARAVFDFGYDPAASELLTDCRPAHRTRGRATPPTRTEAVFKGPDGAPHLQIKALDNRQRTRRLASTIDANGAGSCLPATYASDVAPVLTRRPRFVWFVGPNSIEPAAHVFRLTFDDGDVRFKRVDAVPVPAPA